MIRQGRRVLAILLGAALLLLSPGLAPYQALAGELEGGAPAPVPTLTLPAAPVAAAAAPEASGLEPLPVLPGSAVLGQPEAAPAAAASGAASAAGESAAVTAFQSVQAEAGRLEQTRGESAQAGSLDAFYSGAKEGGDAVAAPDASAAAQPSLGRLGLPQLAALAGDGKTPDADRRSAVKRIADLSTDASRLALRELGTRTGGSAADYEIKRLALRRLAEQGEVVSLPPVSDEHARELLAAVAQNKPQAAAFDYDHTLEDDGAAASAQTAAALHALAASGVSTMVLSDRPDHGRRPGEAGILDALASLTPEQRQGLAVGAFRGAETFAFDADGKARLVSSAEPWTAEQRAAVAGALRRVVPAASASDVTGYDAFIELPGGLDAAAVQKAGETVRSALAGLPVSVAARRPIGGDAAPYLYVSRYDKSAGVRFLRWRGQRLRDAERLPSALKPLGRLLARLMPASDVSAERTLIVGDQFLGERSGDADMLKAAPGALAIAVGGAADPRLDNVFVWNKTGHAAAMELARAASAPKGPAMPGMDWKSFAGAMVARSISIITFVGTTIAYPALAKSVIGAAGFGTVLSLGAVVTIGAGLVVGKFAGKLSPRAGMTLNALLRGLFLLDVPLFAHFGILNFWTLLAGAAANGFVLASVITTEGAYMKELFGARNLGTVNAIFQLSAYAIQVIFGLMLGVGHLVDGHSLLIPFMIAAAAHIGVVMPLYWLLLPKGKKDAPAAAASAKAAVSSAAERFRFFRSPVLETIRRYAPPAAAIAGAVAFFAFQTAMPVTVALAAWMLASDKFLSLARQDKAIAGVIGLVGIGSFMFFGLQNFTIPTMAKILGGANSGLLNGQMLGAMFFGFLLSISSLVKLPEARLPVLGRVGLQRLVQAALTGLAGYWVATGLLPALLPAAGAVLLAAGTGAGMLIAVAAMALAERTSDKGWLSLLGLGFGAMAVPAAFFGSVPVMLAALLGVGYFWGPALTTMNIYLQKRAPNGQIGPVMGLNSSVLNSGISLGVAADSAVSASATPSVWLAITAAAGAAVGAVYFLAARLLPGLSKHLFTTSKEKLKS